MQKTLAYMNGASPIDFSRDTSNSMENLDYDIRQYSGYLPI